MLSKKIIRKILMEVDEQINKLNIVYVAKDYVEYDEYEQTIENLFAVKRMLLDMLEK